ncbi:hypothetical protein JCM18237_30240 [Halorubrum luteum]
MSESPGPGNGSPVGSEAFQEWVEHTASTRGVDEQELLNQLVSAFWVLDEMNGVTGETEPFGTEMGDETVTEQTGMGSPLDAGTDDGDTDPTDSFLGADQPEPTDSSSTVEDDTTTPGSDDGDAGEPSGEETDTSPSGRSATGEGSEEIAEEVRALRESLHTQLEMVQAVSEIRRQLSDLSLDVENQRSRQEQFTDRISDDLTRLHSRVEELESSSKDTETANAEAVDRLAAELREDVESLAATQREFESWIDEEFDEIERLFEHLLDVTDDLDDRLATVETELKTIREEETERERLETLRRTAQRSGIDRAVCGACDGTVDVSMLDEPHCPECETTFEGVDPASGWNPFAKATLRTEPEPPTSPEELE